MVINYAPFRHKAVAAVLASIALLCSAGCRTTGSSPDIERQAGQNRSNTIVGTWAGMAALDFSPQTNPKCPYVVTFQANGLCVVRHYMLQENVIVARGMYLLNGDKLWQVVSNPPVEQYANPAPSPSLDEKQQDAQALEERAAYLREKIEMPSDLPRFTLAGDTLTLSGLTGAGPHSEITLKRVSDGYVPDIATVPTMRSIR